MRTLQLLVFIVAFSFIGCKKDNGSKLPVIKGIQKRDINAQPIGTDGAPNTKTGEMVNMFGDPEIMSYPNPASSMLTLRISNNETQARIRMVKGRYKKGNFGPDDILGIGMNIAIDMTVDLKQSNNISIDLADVPNGYYRLYVAFDSYTLWDNIKVEK